MMQNQRKGKHGGEEPAGALPLEEDPAKNMQDLTDRIVLAVLDYLDGNSTVTSHSMARELLIRAAAKLRQIAATTDMENSAEKNAQLSPSPHSQVDDLSFTCTHDVIDGIIQVYKSNGGGESADLSGQGIQEVMQELGNITSSSRSSSQDNVEVIDLEENTETSVSLIREVGSSLSGQESLLSDDFQQKVKEAVSDVLLRTSGAMSAHSSRTFGDVTFEDLEVYAEQPGTSKSSVVEAAASDIAEMVLEDLKKVSSDNGSEPAPSRKTFSSAAFRMYRNVHYKIFRFLLGLQESTSEKEEKICNEDQSLGSPHLIPRIQLQVGSFEDEVFVKVLETFKSEPLLSSCSCRRASCSATPPAVHGNIETRNTAWAAMNSSREICSRLQDESITPEEPQTSQPFFGLRRVKNFLTHLLTGAVRPSTRHTPITTIKGEDIAEGQEVLTESHSRTEDLLWLVRSDQTLTDRTRDILTRESPGSASIASYRTDNTNSDSPDPASEKKRGLTFRKRLMRTFSALRRALPNPFSCMTSPP